MSKMSLNEIYKKVVEENNCQALDWQNYEFGKSFYKNVFRNEDNTYLESEFIINKLRLKEKSRILDLGCGGGRNAFYLADNANKGFKVTGIDLNLYAIEEAKKTINGNCNFINKNILDIDYKEEFEAIIIVFNHFSNFNLFEAQNILKRSEKALVDSGKVLIEISSESFLESLDNTQEWHFTDNWLSGNFPQLVLIENIYDKKTKIHTRKDHCIKLDDLSYSGYIQKSQAYSPEKINSILKMANLKLTQIYGDWQGKVFEEGDDYMIITAQK